MIHYYDKYVFIHIPRTSGMSISQAVRYQECNDHRGPDIILGPHLVSGFWRHARGAIVAPQIANWDRIAKFAVMRNPWRMCESMYKRMRMRAIESLDEADWKIRSQSFELFLFDHFSYMTGGFWHHWCLSNAGDELGVEPIMFEAFNWQRIREITGLSSERPRANQSHSEPLTWTDTMIDFIRLRCADDFQRFGYPDHPLK